MYYARHAGGCCGIGVIYGFDQATIADLDRCLQEHNNAGEGTNRLCEVVLSERQVCDANNLPNGRRGMANQILEEVRNAGGWPAILQERGFKLVKRFRNSNSGQVCYVWHKIPRELSLENRNLPFNLVNAPADLEPEAAQPVPPPQPRDPRVILNEVYAVFADGRVRGPFEYTNEIREAYPRVRRYQRRIVMDNGDISVAVADMPGRRG